MGGFPVDHINKLGAVRQTRWSISVEPLLHWNMAPTYTEHSTVFCRPQGGENTYS